MPELNFPPITAEGQTWTDNAGADWIVFEGAWTRVGGLSSVISIPVGGLLPYASTVVPQGYLYCNGQAVDRTTYAALFTVIGVTYGVGDGSTTFNMPDCRGRVLGGIDDGADVVTNVSADAMGGILGFETHTLTSTELAAHIHTGVAASNGNHGHSGTASSSSHNHTGSTNSTGNHSHTISNRGASNTAADQGGDIYQGNLATRSTSSNGSHSHSVTINSNSHSHSLSINSAGSHEHAITIDTAGGGAAHNNLQPTMFIYWLIKT